MSVSTEPEITEPLRSIFVRFLKFGCLAWGGPAAQIAMIEKPAYGDASPAAPSAIAKRVGGGPARQPGLLKRGIRLAAAVRAKQKHCGA